MSSGNGPRNKWRQVGVLAAAAALTVALLLLAFPPAELGILAWVALVPVLVALRARPGRTGWGVLWLAGWVFGFIGFLWLRHVTWVGTVLLGFYVSLYFVLFCVVVRWLWVGKGIPLGLAAPLVWTALEHVRSVFLSGIPWLLVAHTQYKALHLIQVADLTGAAGVTFWVVAVNGVLADGAWVLRGRAPVRTWRVLAAAVSVLVISVAVQIYGSHRLNHLVTRRGPRIAVIQGNVPQEVKNRGGLADLGAMYLPHLELTRQAQGSREAPELVIWPETMVPPGLLDAEFNQVSAEWLGWLEEGGRTKERNELLEKVRRYGEWRRALAPLRQRSDLLLGSVRYAVDGGELRFHNAAYLFKRGGAAAAGRYDKVHLVPFGEYVPLKRLIGWLVGPLVPDRSDLSPGKETPLFEVGGWRFAPTICFETGFSELVAGFGRGEEKMDFIVNITNEGWFRDGAELDEHLAIGVFRAIECRAGLVRAANTGISAFISPTGEIVSKLTVGGKDREVAGVLHGVAMTAEGRSPFLAVGQLFGRGCVVACAVLVVGAWLWDVGRRRAAREKQGGK